MRHFPAVPGHGTVKASVFLRPPGHSTILHRAPPQRNIYRWRCLLERLMQLLIRSRRRTWPCAWHVFSVVTAWLSALFGVYSRFYPDATVGRGRNLTNW